MAHAQRFLAYPIPISVRLEKKIQFNMIITILVIVRNSELEII